MNLATIIEAKHLDAEGNVLWQAENLPNTFHVQGEEYILKSLFTGGITPTTTFYVGLDNRSTVNLGDTLSNISGEPSGNGYQRYSLNLSGFSAVFTSVKWQVKTSTLLFNASGGSWGPVINAFLTTGSAGSGYLLATVPLPVTKTINNGESFSFKMVLALGA